MIWKTIADILDTLFVPVMFIFFFTGLFTLISGLRQVHKGMYREQQLSWYEYPNVLNGIVIMLLNLFFISFIAAGYSPNTFFFFFFDLTSVVCACFSIICL